MKVGREGKTGLYLFFILWLPARPFAHKEEPPTAEEQGPGASVPDFNELRIPAQLRLDRKISFVHTKPGSMFRFLFFEGRWAPLPWRAFFKTAGVCPNPLQVL